MIQQLLAKLQTYKQQQEEEEVAESSMKSKMDVSTANPIHLDTPFKLPTEYLPQDQPCPIDKSVLYDLNYFINHVVNYLLQRNVIRLVDSSFS